MKKLDVIQRVHEEEEGHSVRLKLDGQLVLNVFIVREDGLDVAKIFYQNRMLVVPLSWHN